MSTAKKQYKRITTKSLVEMKANGEKISMLTAYDYTMAKILDGAGIDVILVGDSASNVMAGHETTLPITLNEMIYHASSVIRGIERCLVVVDLPFGSYQSETLKNALRFCYSYHERIWRPCCKIRRREVKLKILFQTNLNMQEFQ